MIGLFCGKCHTQDCHRILLLCAVLITEKKNNKNKSIFTCGINVNPVYLYRNQTITVMANWCNNTLEIQGDKLTLINIVRRLESSIEDEEDDRGVFEILVGKVPTGSTEDNHYGTDDIENVRDNFYMVGDIYGDILRFQFESRWSPPDKFVQKLSEKFNVKTELYYDEMGSDICGKLWYTNGELVDSEEYTYLEGQYVFQEYEIFWNEVYNNMEYYFESEDDVEEDGINWFYKNYSYVNDEDKKELLSIYKNEYGNYYGCEVEQTN